ncbi:MAG: AbrB/MazE/SpoVT family DNA-binding domain-containing protein [Blastocatellia bacterium]|nr:AbrB/MazE/SpoVT family DNA-binding domain-containing protein [Blastocatellia bacterium]
MRVQVQKWGNSLALRIPKSFAVETHIAPGSTVDLTLIDGKLIVEPVEDALQTLDGLLANVTSDNLHQPIDSGDPVGNELW